MGKLFLADDGTLDTVFECAECGKEIRYSEFERDDTGEPEAEALAEAEREHAEECEGEEG